MEVSKAITVYLEESYIARVYSIVGAQLLTTGFLKILSEKKPKILRFVCRHYFVTLLFVLTFFSLFIRFCDDPPWNIIIFAVFTGLLGIFVSWGSSTYPNESIAKSISLTSIWFGFLSAYGFHTINEYSILDNLIFAYLLAYCFFFFTIIIFRKRKMTVISAFTASLITSIMTISLTQKMKQEQSIDQSHDFPFFAINFYFIFMILELNFLVIFGRKRSVSDKDHSKNFWKSPLTSFAEKLIDSGELVVIHEEKELRKKISKPCQHSDERKSSGRESPLRSVSTAQMLPSLYKWILSKLLFTSAVEEHDLNSSEQYCQCNNVPRKRKSIWFNEETVYDFEASSYCETESCEKSFCDCSSYSETESKHCQISDGRKSSGRESPLHSVSTAQMLPTNSHSLYKCILSKLLFSSAVEELHSSELYCQCKNVPRKRKSCEESCSESSSCREIESCKESCSESSSDRAPVNRKKVKTDSYPGGNLEIERHMETDPCEKSAAFPKENYSCKEEMTALCRSCQEEMADVCQSCGQQRYFRKGQEPRLRRVYVKTPGGFFIDSSWTHVNCFIPVYPCPYILMPCLDVQSF